MIMKTIYKYPLAIKDQQTIKMPNDAVILAADQQDGELFLWARVNRNNDTEDRVFNIYGTGHEVNEYDLVFIDTVLMPNGLVWHVFENRSM